MLFTARSILSFEETTEESLRFKLPLSDPTSYFFPRFNWYSHKNKSRAFYADCNVRELIGGRRMNKEEIVCNISWGMNAYKCLYEINISMTFWGRKGQTFLLKNSWNLTETEWLIIGNKRAELANLTTLPLFLQFWTKKHEKAK